MSSEKGESNNPEKIEQAEAEPKEELESQEEAGSKEASELKDRLLRLAAEFDNYKKKVANDLKAAKDIGKAELASKLLPSLDEFELAISAICNEKEGAGSGSIKGIELVFSNIIDTLKDEGLKEIDAKGRYDPYKHEVMLTKPSEKEEGTILEVIRKGYQFNDILLRPSSVIISNGRTEDKEKKEKNEENKG